MPERIEHAAQGVGCICGWEAKVGQSVRRAFDAHLSDVMSIDPYDQAQSA